MNRDARIRTGVIVFLSVLSLMLLAACERHDPDEKLARALLEYQEGKYDDEPATGELKEGVREIKLQAFQFFWSPDLIIVNKGEKIRLIISTNDVPHGFEIEGYNIPGYDIATKIEKDHPVTIEFTADESGVWEFICTVYCGAGHGDMKGIFVIR